MAGTDAANTVRGKRALLIGLGMHDGGAGVARYLVRSGAAVTITDRQTADALEPAMQSLAGLPITYLLGGHAGVRIADYDLVVRNPAVPTDAPLLREARAHGIPIEMEMTLFLAACPAPVIGVTGTKGKTTTTLWIGEMLRQWRPETVVAGNMGISALDTLDEISADTPVVLELSSFQLEAMGERGQSPRVAVITNLSPDHLDRYPDFGAYADAKWQIARHQRPEDVLILPALGETETADGPGLPYLRQQARTAPARIVSFGVDRGDERREPGLWWSVNSDALTWVMPERACTIGHGAEIYLPGAHNRVNATAAIAAALSYGAPMDAVHAGLRAFRGVPHRYEDLGEIAGVRFINDTAATAPAAAVAALATTPGPVILLAGGSDKGLDFDDLARAMRGVKAIILFDGRVPTPLAAMVRARGYTGPLLGPVRSMEEAVEHAVALAAPGDTVLLSPGAASFGVFKNEFDRGDQFRAAVARLRSDAEGTR